MYFEIDDYNALRSALHTTCEILRREMISEELLFESKLVATELLSNVLQHGGGNARFVMEKKGDYIRITVKDSSPYVPPEKSVCADVESDHGRGLFLIDSLCSERSFSDEEGVIVLLQIHK